MPSTASLTMADYDGQVGIVGYNIPEVTSANIVAVSTDIGELRTAIEAVTRGVSIKTEMSIISRHTSSNAKSTDELAQRGNKWRVSYRDITEFLDAPTNTIPNPGYLKAFDLEIPTADFAQRVNGSDVVFNEGTLGVSQAFTDLGSAIQDLVLSPYGGAIKVQLIEAVTRSGG